MSVLGDPFTRWAHREGGRLVAIAAKRAEDGSVMVLPIGHLHAPHPLDWMPERVFLETYEQIEGA